MASNLTLDHFGTVYIGVLGLLYDCTVSRSCDYKTDIPPPCFTDSMGCLFFSKHLSYPDKIFTEVLWFINFRNLNPPFSWRAFRYLLRLSSDCTVTNSNIYHANWGKYSLELTYYLHSAWSDLGKNLLRQKPLGLNVLECFLVALYFLFNMTATTEKKIGHFTLEFTFLENTRGM